MAMTLDWGAMPLAGCGETVQVDGIEVSGVLVAPSDRAAADLHEPDAPAGPRIDYRLDFPKSFGGELMGASVLVRGDLVRIVGKPVAYEDELCPGEWNRVAYAAAAPGDMSASVRVMAVSATVDDEGEPARVARMVYEGPAQARMTAGSVAPGLGEERESAETWHFVVPWDDALAGLRPQAAYVEHGGERYDASYVRDVDSAHLFCDIEAVRHG